MSFNEMENSKQKERYKTLLKNQITNIFRSFCHSTTLHGYHYLFDNESHIFQKIVWFLMIMGMTGLGILFLFINTKEFLDHKILTTVETFSAPLTVSNNTYSAYRLRINKFPLME